MSKQSSTLPQPLGLPLVVQVGFGGSRHLFAREAHPKVSVSAFERAVEEHLITRLKRLPKDLGLSERHFPCGISSLAIGADTVFTRACGQVQWPQRLLLPQHREEFLTARNSQGVPDFSAEQRDAALELADSEHVIHERVVGSSDARRDRFEDVNLEIIRICDVLICLVDAEAAGREGGTRELIEDAASRNRPVLVIAVSVAPDGSPSFEERWSDRGRFSPPRLPREMEGLQTNLTAIPGLGEYCRGLKGFSSEASKGTQEAFRLSALIIIGAHVLATLCAVLALKVHGSRALQTLLGIELLLLAGGFATHLVLHRSHAARVWAMARLCAEVARSVTALANVPGYLTHLFSLPIPRSLGPLLRTLNVLHLRELTALRSAPWEERRDAYVHGRLERNPEGQIPYYRDKLLRASQRQAWAQRAFYACSAGAFIATLLKLLLACGCLPYLSQDYSAWAGVFGVLAILLPVVAVAALSLAASFDLEARMHTYKEMHDFLKAQAELIRRASSERVFAHLALETESKLLGETAVWYSRRAFTSVT